MHDKVLTAAATAAAAILAAGSALADPPGWYVQTDAGSGFASQLGSSEARSGGVGYAVSGAIGRDFGTGWRADTEVLYLSAPNRDDFNGRTSLVGSFVNGYYNFLSGRPWQPFVGVGVGGAEVRSLGQNDSGFAYQAKAGLDHPFNSRLTGEIAYRYVGVAGLDSGGLAPTAFHGPYHSSAVTIGLRYRFGG